MTIGRIHVLRCGSARPRARVGLAALCTSVATLVVALVAPTSDAGAQVAATPTLWATYGPQATAVGGPIGVLPNVPMTLHLWAAAGTAVSSTPACLPAATGDEICGIQFRVETSGNLELRDFAGDTAFDSSGQNTGFTQTFSSSLLSANVFDLGAPPIGPRHLGTLDVLLNGEITGSSANVQGRVIRANLEMANLASAPLVVPEAGLALGVALGALALSARARVQAESRRRR